MQLIQHLIMWAEVAFNLLFPKKGTSSQQVCTEGEPVQNPPTINEDEIRPQSLSLSSPRKLGIDWDKVVSKRPLLRTKKTVEKVEGLFRRATRKVSEIVMPTLTIQMGVKKKAETSSIGSQPIVRNERGRAIVVPFNPPIGSLRDNATASGGEPCSFRPTPSE